jgi:hypothetical protein
VAEIRENQAKNSFVYEFKATDTDQNSLVHYKLLNHDDKFYVSKTTGRLYTKVKFNTENQEQDGKLKVQVKAYNPSSSIHEQSDLYATCWLIVRIKNSNSNKPRFSATQYAYHIHIPENSSQIANLQDSNRLTNSFYIPDNHLFVAKISAFDFDLQAEPIKYKIRHTYADNLFEVNELSGLISLNVDVHTQHYRDSDRFSLVLIAYDAYWSAYTNVAVNVVNKWHDNIDLSTLFTSTIQNCSINEDALPGIFCVFRARGIQAVSDRACELIFGSLFRL